MNNEEIKKECERLYKVIDKSKKELEELRSKCKHEKTFVGDYLYGPGRTFPTTMCSDCEAIVEHYYG